jgi:hypothetical protein
LGEGSKRRSFQGRLKSLEEETVAYAKQFPKPLIVMEDLNE